MGDTEDAGDTGLFDAKRYSDAVPWVSCVSCVGLRLLIE